MGPYDDPHFEPPADISGADARAYEEKIVALLRDAMTPGGLESIELRGERPGTEIILRVREPGSPGPDAYKFDLWKSEYPTDGAVEVDGRLQEPASVAAWIYSDWSAGDLDRLDED